MFISLSDMSLICLFKFTIYQHHKALSLLNDDKIMEDVCYQKMYIQDLEGLQIKFDVEEKALGLL